MNELRIRGYCILSFLLLGLASCGPTDYHTIPTFSPDQYVQAVIEIPAGSNHKIEYNKTAHAFEVEERNGRPRVINFLPYPGNYGFIPSTYMDPAKGGDGDALDVLVLAEAVPTKSVIEIIPIALLALMDGGEIDNKIIAVPADLEKQIIKVSTLAELEAQYPAARELISEWFLNYKGPGKMELTGWEDEQAAMADIQKWLQTHP